MFDFFLYLGVQLRVQISRLGVKENTEPDEINETWDSSAAFPVADTVNDLKAHDGGHVCLA